MAGFGAPEDSVRLTGFAVTSGFFAAVEALLGCGSGVEETDRTAFSGAGAVTGLASESVADVAAVCTGWGRVGTA